MGYYTYFQLDVKYKEKSADGKVGYGTEPSALLVNDLTAEIEKMNVFEDGNYDDGWYVCEAKWYDHDKDMLLLSHRFPEFLFVLYGEGENHDDMWYAYYQNGKVQDAPAEIHFDDFDENQLVAPDYSLSFAPDATYSYQ